MPQDHLLYSAKAGVATFTINREPQRNAISLETISLFMQFLDQAEADQNIRVILK